MKKSEQKERLVRLVSAARYYEMQARKHRKDIKKLKAITEFEPEDEMLPIFVYGSIRKGMRNEHYGEGAIRLKASLEGYGLFGKGCSYPWVMKKDGGRVQGELLMFNSEEYWERVRSMDSMERGAGYSKTKVKVKRVIEGGQIEVDAYVYDWQREMRQEQVEHGDWVREVKSRGR